MDDWQSRWISHLEGTIDELRASELSLKARVDNLSRMLMLLMEENEKTVEGDPRCTSTKA